MNNKLVFSFALVLVFAAVWLFASSASAIILGRRAPEIAGEHWINSKPLTIDGLKGRVVLVEFWTYG
jgi:hypothetical protein